MLERQRHQPVFKHDEALARDENEELFGDDDAQEAAWDAAEQFESLKFDKQLAEKWWKDFGSEPPRFFSPEMQEQVAAMPSAQRIVMLARAALHLSVTPSMALKHFERFPEDKRAVESIVLQANGMADDGITHNLFTLVWPHMRGAVPIDGLAGQRRNGGQYDEIAIRRELAPNALLSTHKEGGMRLQEKFGKAAEAYERAASEAHKLAMRGEKVLDVSKVFASKAYTDLPQEQKAELLRLCVDDMHFSLVFDETFNSAFTRERVEQDNERFIERKGERFIPYNPAHSMLFGTKQGSSVYEQPQEYFERDMNSTAMTGGDIEEYPHHRLLLATLKEFQNVQGDVDANTDFLVEFWKKNRNPIFGRAVADALSKQNPDRAASALMQAIPTDTWNKGALASILYRLELGRIGISKEGVRYLGRLYDLGERNNPDFFVNRLTAKGDIGIFDENKQLAGYFNVGDLTSEQTNIRAEVLDVSRDLLFSRRRVANSDEELLQEELLDEFKKHYFELYNERFFENTGVRFNNLSFREQAWFLHFMHGAEANNKDAAMDLVRGYGEDGLKAFLSLEVDRDDGDKVLRLAREGSPNFAQRTFSRHAHVTDSIENIENYLRSQFGSEQHKDAVASIVDRLLTQARNYIEKASSAAGDKEKEDEVLRGFASANSSNILLLHASRVLKDRGELILALIRGAEPLMVRGGDISPQDADAVKALQYQRYGDGKVRADEGYTLETVEGAMAGLEKSLQQKSSRFYLFKLDGKVVACVRFDQQDETGQHAENPTRLYMATVMGDNSIAGGKLAEANAEAAFREEQRQGLPIYATAKPELPIAEKYLEWGFVARSAAIYKNLPLLNIDWNPNAKEKYVTRMKDTEGGMTREEILSNGPALNSESIRFHVFEARYDGKGLLTRPSREDHDAAFAQYNGMAMTRFYYDDRQKRYCAMYETAKD